MTVMAQWWRGLSNAARFDLSARGTLYVNYLMLPVVVGLGLGPSLGPATGVLVAVVAGQGVVCLVQLRAALEHYLGRRPRPTRLIAASVGLAVAAVVGGYLAYPDHTPGHNDGPALWILLLVGGAVVVTLAATESAPVVVTAGAVACGAVYGLAALQGRPDAGAVLAFALLLLGAGAAYRFTAWMLGVMWELDRARHLQARLAVADERLRFARDLHDGVGRTLSVVALKSELAAQLARRGREDAVDEMLAVRRIAQDSLAELHALVSGYRAADLDVELAGARSLLASAGIECRVIGDGGRVPAPVQGALGWVVREGTTNVLRHSEARTCLVAVRVASGGGVSLTMENDGLSRPAGPARVEFGNGLVGVSERIAGLGGTVNAERRDPSTFRLEVTVPAGVDRDNGE
ncbi:sensor histidine kinase [Paractinoplanes hotanensis]|uniref:Histidine kinase n=1 Tax=Paractinoplanes hotanensis TaxID=2906497 RepID=A0ABT0Y080_9ACTN|nr:histidine kinase [Actinoplanes hotanensis]MCM4078872.1 histidine kinase [Actinoplanes hotanensis]